MSFNGLLNELPMKEKCLQLQGIINIRERTVLMFAVAGYNKYKGTDSINSEISSFVINLVH